MIYGSKAADSLQVLEYHPCLKHEYSNGLVYILFGFHATLILAALSQEKW